MTYHNAKKYISICQGRRGNRIFVLSVYWLSFVLSSHNVFGMRGFTAESAAAQKQYETRFKELVSAERCQHKLRYLN